MAARVTETSGKTSFGREELAAWLRAQEKKELVRFVTIGSVDDGKSTLIGRLLHDAHGLYQDQLDAVQRASVRGSTRGAESSSEMDFSLFTDGLAAEREQGITIDVAYRYFATERRKFIIADTPGHVQYTRNMATGASTADVAVILIDARLGVLAQTRRHAHIAALLGIPHVVACVNKMDLVGFDRATYDAIIAELTAIAARVGLRSLFALPISALEGDNVVTGSARMPWWDGGTMLDHLETVPVEHAYAHANAFRFPVQLVLRPHLGYRGFAGTIASGTIRTGDEIVALPSGRRTRVTSVDVAGVDVGVASAPTSIALRFADDIDVSRGDMLARPEDAPRSEANFEANLVWMSERPLDPDKTYLLKHTTRTVRATIEVLAGTDPETLQPAAPHVLALNDIGRVRVRARAPLFFDSYRDNRSTGAFILIDSVTNDTAAAGMIVAPFARSEAHGAKDAANDATPGSGERSQVSARERRERLGQVGAVVTLSASGEAEASSLAFTLERALFDAGRVAVVLHGASGAQRESADACARGGLIAVLAVSSSGDELVAEIAGQRLVSRDAADLVRRVLDALALRV